MKSYQFVKIYKRFDNERRKLIQQSMRREKLKKIDFFITGCFIKSFKKLIIFFYFTSSFAAQFSHFAIRMTQEISKGKLETANS